MRKEYKLLENRVLWGAIVSPPELKLKSLVQKCPDVRLVGRAAAGRQKVEAFRCSLTTPVQYTRATDLLSACAKSDEKETFEFEFLAATLTTPKSSYYSFFVPFRNMLGGVLHRIQSSIRGMGCRWQRIDIMPTVDSFRSSVSACVPCGLDLHLLGRGDQEIVFVGMNPAHNRVFAAIADESENFTLSPISATFCVGTSKESPSYFTIDRNGVLNVAADESFQFLDHLLALVVDLEKHGTLIGLPDKPVYRSRNAHKRAILASISA